MFDRLKLLETITRLHTEYVFEENPRAFFDSLLKTLLEFTGSEYGFIGEVLHDPSGTPYLKTYALTNIAWDAATRTFYEQHAPQGLEFRNLETLFGRVLTSEAVVISNDPANDPRGGGIPPGHPPLEAFLGIPLRHRNRLIGAAGMANRAGGYEEQLVDELRPLWSAVEAMVHSNQLNRAKERAEAEREANAAALHQALELETLGLLAAGVAHDMNNLLLAIMTNSDLLGLQAPSLGASASENLSEIKLACNRAVGLTRQLQTFTQRQIELPTHIFLQDEIAELSKLLRRLIREDIELVTEIDPATPAIEVDLNRLHQVLLNLVINARDAIEGIPGGRIVLAASPGLEPDTRAHGCVISVTDNGSGIPSEALPKIFEPFYTTKAPGHGTGLGLYIVREMVQRFGGRISVGSAPARGTRFEIWLPAFSGEQHEGGVQPDTHLNGDETIWLVEDETSVRLALHRALERAGYRVSSFDNPRAALEAFAAAAPVDLLITDIIMPIMRGHELARELRAHDPRLRVLFTSGYSGVEFGDEVPINVNANFLEKPFTTQRLLLQVRQTLAR